MPAAIPAYLKETEQAAPGHRFGLYFAGWNANWQIPNSKTEIFKDIAKNLPDCSRVQLAALLERQRALADTLGENIITLPMQASAPFATGLGNEHPLENGFAFLTPYGLPYLAGSGVKGVIRRAAEELASSDWGEDGGWTADAIRTLFGPGENDPTRDDDPLQGALSFWDVLPQPAPSIRKDQPSPLLAVEIMTPHHGDYYQNDKNITKTPHNSESPTPIPFLAVAAGSRFCFHVECQPARLTPALREQWPALIEAAFEHAGQWLGFGAKTAVGYGRMQLDPAIAQAREEEREKQHAADKAAAQAAARAALPPGERLLAELDAELARLPRDPRNGNPIPQATSHNAWPTLLELLASKLPELQDLTPAERTTLASGAKERLAKHFKIEGKADKTLKASLAALRGS